MPPRRGDDAHDKNGDWAVKSKDSPTKVEVPHTQVFVDGVRSGFNCDNCTLGFTNSCELGRHIQQNKLKKDKAARLLAESLGMPQSVPQRSSLRGAATLSPGQDMVSANNMGAAMLKPLTTSPTNRDTLNSLNSYIDSEALALTVSPNPSTRLISSGGYF